jgi:Tetratricopeptide repeat
MNMPAASVARLRIALTARLRGGRDECNRLGLAIPSKPGIRQSKMTIAKGVLSTRLWRITLVGTAAIAALAFATCAFVPNAYSTSDVENCDRTLGPATPGLDFSGVFEGSIVDGGQSSAVAQVKFVRNGNAVQGSYLRGEICGSVSGEVTLDRLEFSWEWAGNSGRGIAFHIVDRVSGTFGFREDAKGGGSFVLIQRRAGSPPAAWPEQGLFEASELNKRAIELDNAGRYSEAEPLYKQSLTIREKVLGPDNPDVAAALNNLAFLYQEQGRYAEAGPLYNRALVIKEKALGRDHPDVATSLNNLGVLYVVQGRYSDAQSYFKRALAIREKAFGSDHPDVALTQNNLAELYRAEGQYAEAESLYKRALAIREKVRGPDHPDVANIAEQPGSSLPNPGTLCRS